MFPEQRLKFASTYAESEYQFEKRNTKDYAHWVGYSWPWKLVSRAWAYTPEMLVAHPAWHFGTMVRSASDPGDERREEQGRAKHGFHEQWVKLRRDAKKDPMKVGKLLLAVTKDGRPRTWNRIAFEALGQTADTVPTPVAVEFARLVITDQFAVRFPDHDDDGVFLFWNDTVWRKHFAKSARPCGPLR